MNTTWAVVKIGPEKIQACTGFAPMTTMIPAQRFQHAFFWQRFSKELFLLFVFFQRAWHGNESCNRNVS